MPAAPTRFASLSSFACYPNPCHYTNTFYTNSAPNPKNGLKMVQSRLDRDPTRSGDAAGSESDAPHLPSKSPSGSAAIAARLQQAILDGTYKYGERLPAERELAIHFGASRSTVREALKRLEALHLLSRRVGSGTFVNYRPILDGNNIADITSPLELIEVRQAIEPRIAALAAVNATAKDLARIEATLERLERAGGDREAFSAADERFHLMVVECTHNPLMIWLYQQINDVRGHAQWNRMKETILSPKRISEYNAQHRELFEALSSHNADRAVQAIERHLDKARFELLGAAKQ